MKDKEIDNIESVYLYVKKFSWRIKEDEEHFQGHLKKGRVYLANKENDDEEGLFYTIDLFDENIQPSGILLQGLLGKYEAYDCELIEIDSDEKLLDLDITEDDMAMIALETSHYKSTKERNAKQPTSKKDTNTIKKIAETLTTLNTVDSDMVKYLLLIIAGITEALKDEEYVTLTGHLCSADGMVGRTANITMASAYLEAHLNSPHNNPVNLLNAVFAILLELKRTIKIT